MKPPPAFSYLRQSGCFVVCVLFLFASIFIPSSTLAGERVLFYHNDALGSPVAMTDMNGNIVWQADYEPFGNTTSLIETYPNTHRFVGKELDLETSLHYFGARFYDGGIGRFISLDPLSSVDPRTSKTNEGLLLSPQKLNKYTYSLNNPYRYIDPDGKTVWDIADFAFFGYSFYKFIKDPSWATAGELGLDTLGLLPVVPSIGSIKIVGKGLSKVDEAIEGTRAASKLERHHLLPQEFKEQFRRAGFTIEELEKFTVKLPKDAHRLKPESLHVGSEGWNKQWRQFFAKNPRAEKHEILQHLERMKKDFGLE